MTGSTILVQQFGEVVQVTLDRQEMANAISLQMLSDLSDAFDAAAADSTVRAVIVTGADDRAFSAGADLSELSTDVRDPSLDLWDRLAKSLSAIPVSTLALINGPCIGGCMSLALGCDIRIGVADARFEYPALRNGVFPGKADVDRLRSLIGEGRMSTLLLGGQTVDAQMALSWGLLYRIVPRDDLTRAGEEMTAAARSTPWDNIIAMKRLCLGNQQ